MVELSDPVKIARKFCPYKDRYWCFRLPESIIELGNGAFYACEKLKIVYLNNNLKVIKKECFEFCHVEEVVLPMCLEKIEEEAFYGCRYLKRLIPSSSTKSTEQNLHFDETETSVMPESLREIEKGAFENCDELTQMVLNDGLEKLGEGAFRESGLRNVRMPSTLRKIKKEVFWLCENLKVV